MAAGWILYFSPMANNSSLDGFSTSTHSKRLSDLDLKGFVITQI
jgi:hypothetical protein